MRSKINSVSRNLKKSIDINNNKYVCLFNRDDAYLNSFKKKLELSFTS